MKHAFQKLSGQVDDKKSRIMLGLDEVWEKYSDAQLKAVVRAARENIIGVKLNLAFAEELFRPRYQGLIKWMQEATPELVVVVDSKRGDIANTQQAYAKADTNLYSPDMVTICPYMGQISTIQPYLKANPQVGVFALAATSNKDARPFQDMYAGGIRNYQHMALQVRQPNPDFPGFEERVGLVVGATRPMAARDIRAVELENNYSPSWFLMPGFGAQDGDISTVQYAGPNAIYPLSRQIMEASRPDAVAKEWKYKINDAAAAGYEIKSLSELMIEGWEKNGLIWLAKSPDVKDYRTLASGKLSPIFWDLGTLPEYPELKETAGYLMAKKIREAGLVYDKLAGVPAGATILAAKTAECIDPTNPVRSFEIRKVPHEGKSDYKGVLKKGDRVLMGEDVVTTAKRTIAFVKKVREDGGVVTDVVTLLDRQQGGEEALAEIGVKLHSVTTQMEAAKKLDPRHPMYKTVIKYIEDETKAR